MKTKPARILTTSVGSGLLSVNRPSDATTMRRDPATAFHTTTTRAWGSAPAAAVIAAAVQFEFAVVRQHR